VSQEKRYTAVAVTRYVVFDHDEGHSIAECVNQCDAQEIAKKLNRSSHGTTDRELCNELIEAVKELETTCLTFESMARLFHSRTGCSWSAFTFHGWVLKQQKEGRLKELTRARRGGGQVYLVELKA
jgi:hypothetical protein